MSSPGLTVPYLCGWGIYTLSFSAYKSILFTHFIYLGLVELSALYHKLELACILGHTLELESMVRKCENFLLGKYL